MANFTQLDRLRKGATTWNEWRDKAPDVWVDLSAADLKGADLRKFNLNSVDFMDANLRLANFSQAHLNGADLSNADLTGANLTDVALTTANLTGAVMKGANLAIANLQNTIFADIDLSETVGLDKCQHYGPSTIDHRTLLKSGSSLPLNFLRGCGLPDALIEYLPSLFDGPAIQFYSCFISYAVANQDFADRLYADLQSNGVRCWFAPHHAQPGEKLHEQIDQAIRTYDRLLLILSHESISSEWVKTEIAKARQKEINTKRRVMFPVSIVPYAELRSWEQFNADLGEDSARVVREYYVADFTDWKQHDKYRASFDKVLKALRDVDQFVRKPSSEQS